MNIQLLKLEVQKYIDENFYDSSPIYFQSPLPVERSYSYKIPSLEQDKSDKIQDVPIIFYQESIQLDTDLLEELEPTFSQTLFKFIKAKGISETDCYKKANLDRRLFSKIRSNDDYQPRKNTVFALIIGLRLNLKEAEELLDCAGYSISHSIKLDTIMEYLIKQEVYDILVVNEILDSFNCQLLGQTC